MHELGITQEILDIVVEAAHGQRVARIVLEIGKLSAILPDAIRFCFDLCREGTVADTATLEIIEPPGKVRCRNCDAIFLINRPFARCECGATDLDWLSGEQLTIRSMELV